jgi:hypothetical protein
MNTNNITDVNTGLSKNSATGCTFYPVPDQGIFIAQVDENLEKFETFYTE